MAITLSKVVNAPIADVFDFFDDPAKTMDFNTHAVELEVVDVQPDGRRTFDIVMRSDAMEWMQTVEQVVRERPTRLVTRGGSWTTDRSHWLLTVITDRQFTASPDGTRIVVVIDSRLDQPFRRPVQAIRNWLQQGFTRTEFEHQLVLIARRIEGNQSPRSVGRE